MVSQFATLSVGFSAAKRQEWKEIEAGPYLEMGQLLFKCSKTLTVWIFVELYGFISKPEIIVWIEKMSDL